MLLINLHISECILFIIPFIIMLEKLGDNAATLLRQLEIKYRKRSYEELKPEPTPIQFFNGRVYGNIR